MSMDAADITDWQDDGASVGLPEETALTKPADAIEPPTPGEPLESDEHDADAGAGAPAGERDASGRFKPRQRAASQRATPDDVATINALTARIKAAEEAEGADIARKDGESDRVYTLRRRAELAERRRAALSPQPPESPQARSSSPGGGVQPAPRSPVPAATPTVVDDPEPNPDDATKYPDGVYDRKYINDYARWAARAEHRDLTAKAAAQHAETTRLSAFGDSLEKARAKFTDFDAVVFNKEPHGIPENGPLDLFLMDAEANHGYAGELLYHLRKNPAELRAILAKGPIAQLADLSLLVQRFTQPPPTRSQAGPTRAAAASESPNPVPKPPTLVRTGPVSVNTDAPGDDDSLEAHERHYYPNGRRRTG